MNERKSSSKLWIPAALGGLLLGLLFVPIYNLLQGRSPLHRNLLDQTIEIISSDYVDEINPDSLRMKAIPLILQMLDPHSTYMTKEESRLEDERLGGFFYGIGVSYNRYTDTVIVEQVVPQGPSERAGLKPGDRLVSVNGNSLLGHEMSNQELQKYLRGGLGSIAQLHVVRRGVSKNIRVVRGEVPLKSIEVAYLEAPHVGVIRIDSWGRTTPDEFINVVARLKKQGARALVIDLRDNVGGYMEAAIALSNQFLKKGQLIVYTYGHRMPRENVFADGTGLLQEMPLAVLVNEFSASASEIFAGAMQDHDRAVIVGRRTFGKGLVQRAYVLPDSSTFRLTIARYYTPSGRSIQKKYTMGDTRGYESELLHRYEDGEIFNGQDSLPNGTDTTRYFTDSGRVVYAERGIVPDLFVPTDSFKVNSYYNRLLQSGTVPEFAFFFVDKNRTQLTKMSSMDELFNYLSARSYIVWEYARYAGRKKGIELRSSMLQDVQEPLLRQLFAYIAYYVQGREGMYRINADQDIVLRKALTQLAPEYNKPPKRTIKPISVEESPIKEEEILPPLDQEIEGPHEE